MFLNLVLSCPFHDPKCVYAELAAVLEYAFGQLDVASGGGLEAHPRLTTGTLYRAADSATTMRKARETVLSLAPQGFSISLSEPAITIY